MIPAYGGLYRTHRDAIWSLSYRMTGSAADADDVVQETFRRALESPPPNVDRPWRPWLLTVASRVAIDTLRRRKKQGYVGPWLPSAVDTAALIEVEPGLHVQADEGADHRYDRLESASLAFLTALEALDPVPRAVLLLRDVWGYAAAEVGNMLELSEANVRVITHRARAALAAYDHHRAVGVELGERNRAALERFMGAVARGDVAAAATCLADDARVLSDGGGRYNAALRPIVGAENIAKLYVALARSRAPAGGFEFRHVNGAPAILVTIPPRIKGDAPRTLISVHTNDRGQIVELYSILADEKLAHLRPAV